MFRGIKKNILLRTNLILLIIFILGFAGIYAINCRYSNDTFKRDIEHISVLASESLSYQIDALFVEPLNISITMAADTFLKDFLADESSHLEDADYLNQISKYLYSYKEKYGCDSVFLISAQTGRYYHFHGQGNPMIPSDPESDWYYNFLKGNEEYSLNVKKDEALVNSATIFINCKIADKNGSVLGVAGVGLQVPHLQKLLQSYDDRFQARSFLLNESGIIQLSSRVSDNAKTDFFKNPCYSAYKDIILEKKVLSHSFWTDNSKQENDAFIVTQYIPALKWYLLIEKNTELIKKQLRNQFLMEVSIYSFVVLLALIIISRLIWGYRERLAHLIVSQELEYQQLLHKTTEGLYENVFEMDITHNRAAGESTRKHFELLGLSPDASYEEALKAIAEKQVKEEFRQGYLDTFSIRNILQSYHGGQSELYYDLMITTDGENYYWLRIRARLFYWACDQSLRMITYRQNIDKEKRREEHMLQMTQRDSFTGLYNKTATKNRINDVLEHTSPDCIHAFIILDIDEFKQINDILGHPVGDQSILEVSDILKNNFRTTDICGRVGGDEFLVFLQNIPDREWLEEQAQMLLKKLHRKTSLDGKTFTLSASIGIALYPEAGKDFDSLYKNADSALYLSKKSGKNQYSIYTA